MMRSQLLDIFIMNFISFFIIFQTFNSLIRIHEEIRKSPDGAERVIQSIIPKLKTSSIWVQIKSLKVLKYLLEKEIPLFSQKLRPHIEIIRLLQSSSFV